MKFTDAQTDAIIADDPVIVTIAGAGSGKTAVLTERAARRIMLQKVGASELLCFTFTRRTARQMRERLTARLGGNAAAKALAGQATIGTFHAIAFKFLCEYGSAIGYPAAARLSIITPAEATALLRRIAVELGYRRETASGGKWSKGINDSALSKFLECHYTGMERQESDADSMLDAVVQEYWSRLKCAAALDFGLILKECNRMLLDCPHVTEALRERYREVMVDEVQDTDRNQYTLHRFIAPPASLFMVGDRRQAIYRWRGADPALMTDLYPGARIIDLRECFRCGNAIVAAANRLIERVADPLAKPMIGATGREGEITELVGGADAIAERVEALRSKYKPGQIAIIARDHRTLDQVAPFIRGPVERTGVNRKLADYPNFITLFAALKLTANRGDRIALLMIHPFLRITSDMLSGVYAGASVNRDLLEGVARVAGDDGATGIMRRCKAGSESLSDFIDRLAPELPAAADWAVRNFWVENFGDETVADAVSGFGTFDFDAGDDHKPGERVTLITAHAAKGLEWDAVILAGLNAKRWPSNWAKTDNDRNDEYRVGYVGVTRAGDSLTLHSFGGPDHDGAEPSPFIREMLPELLPD